LEALAQPISKSGYGQYLLAILREPYFASDFTSNSESGAGKP
jgi:hypothetical protein